MFINRKIKGIKGGGEKKYRFKKLIRVQLSFFFCILFYGERICCSIPDPCWKNKSTPSGKQSRKTQID